MDVNNTNTKSLSNIKEVINIISKAFELKFKPQTILPPPLVYSQGKIRQGLSAKQIAANIIKRQGEAGANFGVMPDGSDNISEKMELIRMEELIDALLTQAKIQISIAPGVPITGTGTGVGVIKVEGATSNFATGFGMIS